MAQIAKLIKGGTPSLQHTEKGNELIDWVNSIINMKVSPSSLGSFMAAKGSSVLDLSALGTQISNLTNITLTDGTSGSVTTIVNNVYNNVTNVSNRTTVIEGRLNAAGVSAVCNPDGTITVTLTL